MDLPKLDLALTRAGYSVTRKMDFLVVRSNGWFSREVYVQPAKTTESTFNHDVKFEVTPFKFRRFLALSFFLLGALFQAFNTISYLFFIYSCFGVLELYLCFSYKETKRDIEVFISRLEADEQ